MRRSLAVAFLVALAGCLGVPGKPGTGSGLEAVEAGAGADELDPAQATGRPGGARVVLADGPQPFPAGAVPLELAFTIDTATAAPARAFEAFDTHALNVVDLDGDGRREIVSMNDNKRTYVFSADGQVLAELETRRPDGDDWPARDLNGVAVGDLTGDGLPELAVLNSAASLAALALDREASTPERFVFGTLWEKDVSVVDLDPSFYDTHPWFPRGEKRLGADGNPFIVHLPDGTPVVLAQSDGSPAHIAFNGTDGAARWYTSWWDGNSGPWAGPLRPGGPVTAVFATDSGHVVAYDVATGAIRWTFEARKNGADPGSIPIMPAVVDLRGDGNRSIFVAARVAVQDDGADWMQRQHARYFLLGADGKVLWNASFPWGNPLQYADPAVLDVDGDGTKDLVVLDWNTIGHNPGAWEKTGPANLFAIDGATGQALWRRPLDAQWSNTGLAIAGFVPGQGPSVLTAEQRGPQDGLSFVGVDGERHGWMPLPEPGWSVRRGPAVADLDGDGRVEVVVPVSRPAAGCPQPLDVGCRAGALLVYRSQASAASVLFDGNLLFSDLVAP